MGLSKVLKLLLVLLGLGTEGMVWVVFRFRVLI